MITKVRTKMTQLGYNIWDLKEINLLLEKVGWQKRLKTNKGVSYFNIPCAFDIETSSITEFSQLNNGITDKSAIMYVWQLSINGEYIMGRTWEDFKYVYNKLVEHFSLNEKQRLIIYVHNLSFEFQFMRKHFTWLKVFSLDKRKPIQAVTVDGIEFRCSYMLSGFSLAKLGDQLIKYKARKKTGDLDYSLLRHCKTPLTNKEIEYCIGDVEVVTNYIKECIENDGDITRIPLTKTGYVRNYCRNNCFMKPHEVSVM